VEDLMIFAMKLKYFKKIMETKLRISKMILSLSILDERKDVLKRVKFLNQKISDRNFKS